MKSFRGSRSGRTVWCPTSSPDCNAIGRTCQCCAQGKDARRPIKQRRCCALPRPVCCGDFPSARTVKGVRSTLRAALAHAQVEELVSKNVATMVTLPPLWKRKASTWTSEQARTFLESAREAGDPPYAAYVLVLVLGLRKGEVLGPLWSAVDWCGWDKPCDEHSERQCEPCGENFEMGLQVEKQIQRVKGRRLHRHTKTEESDAPLPLPPICVTALRLRQLLQQQSAKVAGSTWQDTG